ncbi:MAG TPA: LexA family transcriptional regulator [Tepidisphaeraceae bacterium]|nr:LexA family transcriptional regulator [Tepidisphaeraceae bacterium]
MDSLGAKIRKQRRRLGLTLDELAGRTAISKPYLSLIETGRVINPPSDEKLRRLEQTLGFPSGELLTQAHLQRTPRDVRAVLHQLMAAGENAGEAERESAKPKTPDRRPSPGGAPAVSAPHPPPGKGASRVLAAIAGGAAVLAPQSSDAPDLDAANLSDMLQDLVARTGGGLQQFTSNIVPVINRATDGYPVGFSDFRSLPRAPDEYVSCPDINDADAFAARVHGDSMTPKYREGDIVIFSPARPPLDGDDCFIRFADGKTTFKRLFFESNDAGHPHLRLQPRNERHRAQILPSEQVSGLFKAVYRYQRVDDDG